MNALIDTFTRDDALWVADAYDLDSYDYENDPDDVRLHNPTLFHASRRLVAYANDVVDGENPSPRT